MRLSPHERRWSAVLPLSMSFMGRVRPLNLPRERTAPNTLFAV